MAKFTDRLIAELSCPSGKKDQIVFDTEVRGLGIRVSSSGRKNFLVQWRCPATGESKRLPLGAYGNITLKAARDAARIALGQVAQGRDPAAERRARRDEAKHAAAESQLTLSRLIGEWDARHLVVRKQRYRKEAVRALRYGLARYLEWPAAKIERAQAVEAIDALERSGGSGTADRTRAYARALFNWAMKRGLVETNPFLNLPLAPHTAERDRVLSDNELAAIWLALNEFPYPFGPFCQLLILTGQRRQEVAAMRWSEITEDFTEWTIPADRAKNGKPHPVSLSAPAGAILKELRDAVPRNPDQDLVFTTNGKTPISGFSRFKAALDLASGVNRWRFHDIRRTLVSKLAELGVDHVVADKILAHKQGAIRGVARVYQRYEYGKERKAALDLWADYLTSITDI
jgi:integrase